MREIDLGALSQRAVKGWKTPAAFAAIGILFTLITFPSKQPVFRVLMSVSPAPSASAAPIEGTGAGALSALLGSSSGSADYTHYQMMLTSTAVAQRLADRYGLLQQVFSGQWDARTKSWHPPKLSLVQRLKQPILRLANIPPWQPPDATALADYLKGTLQVTPSSQNDVVEIEVDTGDVAFGKKLMLMAHKEANNILGEQVARHATQEANYLERKLAQTAVADYRNTLLALLSQQEKTIMLTQTDASYAAEILNPPVASSTPISPRPILSLFLSALIGVILGLLTVVFFGPAWFSALLRRLGAAGGAVRAGRYGDILTALRG